MGMVSECEMVVERRYMIPRVYVWRWVFIFIFFFWVFM